MAKYSYEFKLKAVQAYLNGEGSYAYLAKKYNISACSNFKEWVHAYREFGKKGLMRSRKNKNYSFQFKLSVVELYLSSEVSYQALAFLQDINNPSLIARWVNDFRIAGCRRMTLANLAKKVPTNIDKIKIRFLPLNV